MAWRGSLFNEIILPEMYSSSLRRALASVCIPLSLAFLTSSPVDAQSNSVRPSKAVEKAIDSTGPKGLTALTGVLALNICYLAEQKIPYQPSVISATAALSRYVRDVHGGKLQGVPPAVKNSSNLEKWLALEIQLRAVSTCPNSLPSQIVQDSQQIRLKLRQSSKN